MKFFKKNLLCKISKKSYSLSNVDLIIDRIFAKIEKGFILMWM